MNWHAVSCAGFGAIGFFALCCLVATLVTCDLDDGTPWRWAVATVALTLMDVFLAGAALPMRPHAVAIGAHQVAL